MKRNVSVWTGTRAKDYARVSERPVSEQDRSLGDTVDRGRAGVVVMGGSRVSPNVRYVGDVMPSGRRIYSVSPTYFRCR